MTCRFFPGCLLYSGLKHPEFSLSGSGSIHSPPPVFFCISQDDLLECHSISLYIIRPPGRCSLAFFLKLSFSRRTCSWSSHPRLCACCSIPIQVYKTSLGVKAIESSFTEHRLDTRHRSSAKDSGVEEVFMAFAQLPILMRLRVGSQII